MLMRNLMLTCAALAAVTLASCRIIPTAEVEAARNTAGNAPGETAFNPDKMVDDIWASKVIPYLAAKAGPFAEVRDLARKSPDDAGRKYGFRVKEGGAPWTLAIKAEGHVVEANTASRAATIGVDTDGDGKSDLTVQIGPAMRGTALRDSLDFVSFNSFTNQIDFAQFGKAFNQHVNRTVLQALPRDGLVGRTVTVLGVYSLDATGQPPLVTPAQITLGPAP
jgi:predicted lipoprotein